MWVCVLIHQGKHLHRATNQNGRSGPARPTLADVAGLCINIRHDCKGDQALISTAPEQPLNHERSHCVFERDGMRDVYK